jgi:mono/diheme cytochrome c family protein
MTATRIRKRSATAPARLRYAIPLLLGAMLGVPAAGADDRPPEVVRGEQVAGEHCATCHRAKGDEQSTMESGAIAFQDLAMDPDRTPDTLRAFMEQDHPFMPFDQLDAQDREDILAYILWLAPRP